MLRACSVVWFSDVQIGQPRLPRHVTQKRILNHSQWPLLWPAAIPFLNWLAWKAIVLENELSWWHTEFSVFQDGNARTTLQRKPYSRTCIGPYRARRWVPSSLTHAHFMPWLLQAYWVTRLSFSQLPHRWQREEGNFVDMVVPKCKIILSTEQYSQCIHDPATDDMIWFPSFIEDCISRE